eukprot:1143472-Pleurochrysis_carterae.AAC.1
MSNASAVCTPDTCDNTAAELLTMPGLVVMLSIKGANAVSCKVTPLNLVRRGTFTVPFSVGLNMTASTFRAKTASAPPKVRYDDHVLAGVPEGSTGTLCAMWMYPPDKPTTLR